MGLFDSIIDSAKEKFGLSTEKASGLLAALLAFIAEPSNGGIGGFFDRFRNAGLGGVLDSWIGTGKSEPITEGQLETALGNDAIDSIAARAGVGRETAASAIAGMLPQVVDTISPEGEVPDNEGFLSKIGGFLSDWGGAIGGAVAGGVGAAAAMAGNAADKVGDAANATYDKGKKVVDSGIESVRNVGDSIEDGGGSLLKWLLLLGLLALAIILGYMYCGSKPTTPANTNSNANANANRGAVNANANTAALQSSFAIKADNGKYTVTGVVPDEATKKKIVDSLTAQFGADNVNFDGLKVDAKAEPFADGWWDNFAKMLPNLKDWKTGSLAFAGNAITEAAGLPAAAMDQLRSLFSGWTLPGMGDDANAKPAETRELGEVTLPDGTKLQAYPGGIEDQLVKFISSDYKTADEAALKDKWFNFDDLNFEHATTKLTPESKRQLDNIVAILKAFPDVKIKIGGYTDKTGDDAANLKLSDSRAKAVQDALKAAGVGAQVPEAEGYGEQFATVDEGASDEARAVDRKTAIRLLK
jgi:uncharacterized protein YidB (DUF937 family)/outer membrane protein OmpA-like peptidoglycan-associated protein